MSSEQQIDEQDNRGHQCNLCNCDQVENSDQFLAHIVYGDSYQDRLDQASPSHFDNLGTLLALERANRNVMLVSNKFFSFDPCHQIQLAGTGRIKYVDSTTRRQLPPCSL